MDGIKSSARVIVMGTTNCPNSIDVGVPDTVGRLEILRILTKRMKLAEDVDLKRISRITHGHDGDDLANLCAEALLGCMRENIDVIDLGKMDVIDLESDTIDGEILYSMTVTNKHFRTALGTSAPSALCPFLDVPYISWQDIYGLENVKREVEKARYRVMHPNKFQKCGMSPLVGFLFYGPPGCGKTLLAKAIANECQANFISVKVSELLTMQSGENVAYVGEICDKACGYAPCVLFFHELDSITTQRGSSIGDDKADRVLNQLLEMMDAMSSKKTVVIIGATNKPNIVDPSFFRPGRLDRRIYIPLPDEESRLQILKDCLVEARISEDVDLVELAKQTDGFSGVDITDICQRAWKYAIRDNNKKMTFLEQFKSRKLACVKAEEIRTAHFHESMKVARKTVNAAEIIEYQEFAQTTSLQRTQISVLA